MATSMKNYNENKSTKRLATVSPEQVIEIVNGIEDLEGFNNESKLSQHHNLSNHAKIRNTTHHKEEEKTDLMFQFNKRNANLFKYELKYERGFVTLSPKEGIAPGAHTYTPGSRLGDFITDTRSQGQTSRKNAPYKSPS